MDEKVFDRVSRALSVGADVGDVHDILVEEGLSEEEVFLAYQAGKLLYKSSLSRQIPDFETP